MRPPSKIGKLVVTPTVQLFTPVEIDGTAFGGKYKR